MAFDFGEKYNSFKTIPYNFKDYYSCKTGDVNYFKNYLKWLDKKIAADDTIDFCFLFETKDKAEFFSFEYFKEQKKNNVSSWNKDNIRKFCKMKFGSENIKINYDEDDSFYVQNVNAGTDGNIKNLYLKCIPQFSEANEQPSENDNDSYVYGYFHNKLLESLKRYTS